MSTFVLKRKTFSEELKQLIQMRQNGQFQGATTEQLKGQLDKMKQQTLTNQKTQELQKQSTKFKGGFNKALGGVKSMYANAGTMGKAGMIGAGVLGAGLMAKGAASMFGGNKE
jgi:hypothetical protein